MSTSRRGIGDFCEQALPQGMVLAGASVLFKTIKVVQKKPLAGDNSAKLKYQHLFFLKNITQGFSGENSALREVAAMEFLRLMIPRQPKARRVLDHVKHEDYVQSKAIPGAINLTYLNKHDELKLSITNYGTESGYKGLGELNFFALFVLDDGDHSCHNVLADQQGWLHRIDGGRAWGDSKPDMLWGKYHKQLLANDVYCHELYKSLLKLLVLPDSLICIFLSRVFPVLDEKVNVKHFSARRELFYADLVSGGAGLEEALCSNIAAYLVDDQAAIDFVEHKNNLLNFKMTNKLLLVSPGDELLQEMDRMFSCLREQLQQRHALRHIRK